MTLIHYSRNGYNGNYFYTSVCGKEVRTHNDAEIAVIHPEKANCADCLKTSEFVADLLALKTIKSDVQRRIYIESDILQADELASAKRSVRRFLEHSGSRFVDRVFSQVFDYAWHHLDEVWEGIKNADEIYCTSSLMPLSGDSYMGAPVIFNEMCKKAVTEGVKGKSVFIMNTLENINWYMIKMDVMKKAFEENDLYMYNNDYEFEKVDVLTIKK